MSKRLVVALLAVAGAFAACGEGSTGGPVQADLSPPEVPATETPEQRPIQRTVSQRNPYGNVAASDNLLWDGDFEFRPSFPEQYGWLVGYGFGVGFGLPNLATGARCKSGIKCALLSPGESIIGIVVAEAGKELAVSFWAFPDDGSCAGINAAFLASYDDFSPSDRIEPVDGVPDEGGWCRFERMTPPRSEGAYLSIENQSGAIVIVDDAVVQAVEGEQQKARSSRTPAPFTAEEEQRFAALRKSVHRARLPRRAPPSRGQQELSAHLKRLMR